MLFSLCCTFRFTAMLCIILLLPACALTLTSLSFPLYSSLFSSFNWNTQIWLTQANLSSTFSHTSLFLGTYPVWPNPSPFSETSICSLQCTFFSIPSLPVSSAQFQLHPCQYKVVVTVGICTSHYSDITAKPPIWRHDWSLQLYTCTSNIWSFIDMYLHSSPSTGILRTHNVTWQLPDGLIAQLVEHYTCIAEVLGSNPVQA